MIAKGLNPGCSPDGTTMSPSTRLTSAEPPMASHAQRRQARSTASCSDGVRGICDAMGSASEVHAVNEGGMLLDEEELRDGISIGDHHQEDHQRVPEGEAVEGRG